MQWNYHSDYQHRPSTYTSSSNFNIRRFSSFYNTPDSPCQCIKLRNCAPFVEVIRRSSPTSRSLLESLRSKICGYDGSDVKVCCPTFDQRRRRDSFRDDTTTEQPWVWDVEETTTTIPSYHNINLNDRFGSTENSEFHNFLKPHRTEFGDVDSSFNEFHHNSFKRKPPKPFRKHEILFHFEDPTTSKNCPPPISNEFELPDDFKHVVPPIHIHPTFPTINGIPTLATTPQTPQNWNIDSNKFLGREEKMKLVNTEYCGISVNTRIIGGEDAGPGQFPWMARLAYVQ